MKNKFSTPIGARLSAAMLLGAMGLAQPAMAQQRGTVYLTSDHVLHGRVIELLDANCGHSFGTVSFSWPARYAVSICLSSAGFGNIVYRNVKDNSGMIFKGGLRSGDSFSP